MVSASREVRVGHGPQDIQIGDVFSAAGEHDRQRAQDRARPMPGPGGDELTQTVLAQAPEPERVNKERHHIQPGMGDQRLPRRGDRKGRENSGNLGPQKGASFSRWISASTTVFSQLRSTFRRLTTPDGRHPHENPGLSKSYFP